MSTEDLARRIAEFLARQGEPVSSLVLTDRFLRLRVPNEDLAARILESLLAPLGAKYTQGVGWILPCEGRPVRSEDRASPATSRRVACAVSLGSGNSARPSGRRIAHLCLIEIPGDEPSVTSEGPRPPPRRIDRCDWRAIGDLLDGAEAIFIRPEIEAAPILAELERRGLPRPARSRALGAAVRGAARMPRGSGVEEICHALGCSFLEGNAPADAASNIAACLVAAGRRRATVVAEPVSEGDREIGYAPAALSPVFLSSVPSRPGVYRFYDAEGRLLYVGKAADLRRRLSSYARPGASGAGGRKIREAIGSLDRVEYEVVGSDLEALLKEAHLIVARSPRANIHREVHERGRAYASGRAQALILPSRDPGSIAAVFVRDGRCEGWVRIGPRGGGEREALRILRRFFRSPGPSRREGDPPLLRGGERPRRRARGGRPPADAASEILRTWMARYGEQVSLVDLDACRGPSAAIRLLRQARREAVEGEERGASHIRGR